MGYIAKDMIQITNGNHKEGKGNLNTNALNQLAFGPTANWI